MLLVTTGEIEGTLASWQAVYIWKWDMWACFSGSGELMNTNQHEKIKKEKETQLCKFRTFFIDPLKTCSMNSANTFGLLIEHPILPWLALEDHPEKVLINSHCHI